MRTQGCGRWPHSIDPSILSPMSDERAIAKLFQNGSSQAVRLPKAFRFVGREVSVRREGDAVVLEPVKATGWPRGFWHKLPTIPDGFELPVDPSPPPMGRWRARR